MRRSLLGALNHDLYSSNPIIVGDMQRIIEKGERPPDVQNSVGPSHELSSSSSTKYPLVQLEPARGVGPCVQVAARGRDVGVAECGLHLGALVEPLS